MTHRKMLIDKSEEPKEHPRKLFKPGDLCLPFVAFYAFAHPNALSGIMVQPDEYLVYIDRRPPRRSRGYYKFYSVTRQQILFVSSYTLYILKVKAKSKYATETLSSG